MKHFLTRLYYQVFWANKTFKVDIIWKGHIEIGEVYCVGNNDFKYLGNNWVVILN